VTCDTVAMLSPVEVFVSYASKLMLVPR